MSNTDDRYQIDKVVLYMVRMDPPDNLVYRRTIFYQWLPESK